MLSQKTKDMVTLYLQGFASWNHRSLHCQQQGSAPSTQKRNRQRTQPIAAYKGRAESPEDSRQRLPEVWQSIPPPPTPPPRRTISERTAFVGALAAFIGLSAIALWSSQSWRLPWQKRRWPQPQLSGSQHGLQDKQTAAAEPAPDELDLVVDDVPPRETPEMKSLEVQRLRAAGVALERRLSQLDASRDRDGGVPAPFTPSSDRPWTARPRQPAQQDQPVRDQAPPSDLVSSGSPPQPDGAAAQMQKEIDELDREAVAAEQAEIREALRTLDGAIDAAEKGTSAGADEAPDEAPELDRSLTGLEGLARPRTDEEPVFPKASELQWREEPLDSTPDIATSAEPASDSGRVQETGLAQLHPPAQQGGVEDAPAAVEAIVERPPALVEAEPQPKRHVRRSQKPVPKVPGQLRLVAGGACIPAPSKLAAGKGGEDALFVSEALWGAIGVADGVGSWSQDGIDTSLYSSRLLEVAAAATENGWGRSKGQGARGLMHIAQTGTMDVPGTSTACIALMMLGRTLQVANLGDSGFRVFRDGRCLFSSEVQQHSFNCPYQAGSPRLHPNSNTANDAEVYELDLQEGDLVVMATDGVFDNLWDRDLEKILGSCYADDEGPVSSEDACELAQAIAECAHARGMDARVRTPWIVEAAKHQPQLLPWHLRIRPRGGKPDDCTVVVAIMRGDENQY